VVDKLEKETRMCNLVMKDAKTHLSTHSRYTTKHIYHQLMWSVYNKAKLQSANVARES